MATKKQGKQAGKKTAGRSRKMVIMDPVMSRRLAALAAWQGRSESSIVCEALRPMLADVAVTGGSISIRGQSTEAIQEALAQDLDQPALKVAS